MCITVLLGGNKIYFVKWKNMEKMSGRFEKCEEN